MGERVVRSVWNEEVVFVRWMYVCLCIVWSVVWRWAANEFDQCGLTGGVPPSWEYVPGCSKDEHYLAAWDCQENNMCKVLYMQKRKWNSQNGFFT